MIVRLGRQIGAMFRKGHYIAEVRHGLHLVWQSVRSCFGSGAWLNDKPFINDEAWKNN